jgi:hypothetical protein
MLDALLEAFSYALRRNGVQVAAFEDLVDNGRVGCLDIWGQALCMQDQYEAKRVVHVEYALTRHGRDVALLHFKGREKLGGMRL